MTEGRGKPPICPWRIEIGDPENGAHTLFLHVFEIADEQVHAPTDVKFFPPAGIAIGERRRVSFNSNGPLGGKVNENTPR